MALKLNDILKLKHPGAEKHQSKWRYRVDWVGTSSVEIMYMDPDDGTDMWSFGHNHTYEQAEDLFEQSTFPA